MFANPALASPGGFTFGVSVEAEAVSSLYIRLISEAKYKRRCEEGTHFRCWLLRRPGLPTFAQFRHSFFMAL